MRVLARLREAPACAAALLALGLALGSAGVAREYLSQRPVAGEHDQTDATLPTVVVPATIPAARPVEIPADPSFAAVPEPSPLASNPPIEPALLPATPTAVTAVTAVATVVAPPALAPVPAAGFAAPAGDDRCSRERLTLAATGAPVRNVPVASASSLRPILVQIDNAIPARPPLHLSEAAIVYESVAEGGVTRFSALFDREDVGVVGPVRSARLVSIEVARQFDALLVYHGASSGVQDFIWTGGIQWVSFLVPDTAPIHGRLASRPAPYNSITWLPRVRAYAEAQGISSHVASPRDLPRGATPPAAGAVPALRFSVGFAGPDGTPFPGYRADFAYDPATNRYARAVGGAPHVDGASGAAIAAETVVVHVAPVVVTDIVEDIYGSRSLDYQLTGAGTAYFMRDGLRWDGCWLRMEPFALTHYVLADGTTFPFGSGPVWIALAMPTTPLRWG